MQAIRMAVKPHQERISLVEAPERGRAMGSVGAGGVLNFFLEEAMEREVPS
jgi:hypothetical protein